MEGKIEAGEEQGAPGEKPAADEIRKLVEQARSVSPVSAPWSTGSIDANCGKNRAAFRPRAYPVL